MLYTKTPEMKKVLLTSLESKGEDITPENLMKESLNNKYSFGYLRHDADDSVYLILNSDLIYLDSEAEITKTRGSYKKYEDIMSGVTELENKMTRDIDHIMSGTLDVLCLGDVG